MNESPQQKVKPADWVPLVRPFARPQAWRSLAQVLTSYLPFLTLWYLAYRALEVHWGLTLALDLAAAFFLVRIFILQHDAGHGSFFKNPRANDVLGFVSGVLTLTPYGYWQHAHARHHATSGNLDKRGVGDIYTMTTEEYLAATPWQRFSYRVYRNPFVMFLIGPIWVFMLSYRLPLGYGSDKPKVRASVWWTNLALAGLVALVFAVFGWKAFLLVYLPVQYFAAMIGIFLFYVQHQFEDAYWEPDPRWEYLKAAMEGSTYLKLPRLLQWLTGNIGLHHVHHLAPKIPNYRLQEAHDRIELMKAAPTVTLGDAFKIAFADLHLYDAGQDRLVGFREVAAQARAADRERTRGERTVQ